MFLYLKHNFPALIRARGSVLRSPIGTSGLRIRLHTGHLGGKSQLRKEPITVRRQSRWCNLTIGNIATRAQSKRQIMIVRVWNGRARGLQRLQLKLKPRFGIEKWRKWLMVLWEKNNLLWAVGKDTFLKGCSWGHDARAGLLYKFFMLECAQKLTEAALCKSKEDLANKSRRLERVLHVVHGQRRSGEKHGIPIFYEHCKWGRGTWVAFFASASWKR